MQNTFTIDKNPAGGFTVFSDINGVKDYGIYNTTKKAALKRHATAVGVDLACVKVIDWTADVWQY